MQPSRENTLERSLKRHLLILLAAVICLLAGAATLAAAINVSGAVIANGTVVVQSDLKKVQHPTGGIVDQILVNDGSRVKAGQILIKLDPTIAKATLASVNKDLWELSARRARLEAERDGSTKVTFSHDLLAAATDKSVAALMDGEKRLFAFRLDNLKSQKAQLEQQIGQLAAQAQGINEQLTANEHQRQFIQQELDGVRDLWQQKLAPLTRLNALQGQLAGLEGDSGQYKSDLAQTRGKIAEIKLQIIQLDQTRRTDAAKDLADIRSKMSELTEKRITAIDQLKRIDIRAPQSGIVHELSVHTKGGVVSAGEQLMLIVPDTDALEIAAQIPPRDIDRVKLGQTAMLRFPAFDERSTPDMKGVVSRIAADTTKPKGSDQAYYSVRIRIPRNALPANDKLVPGMPAEVFIQTVPRTIVSYLIKPIADQSRLAFHEK